MQILLSNEKCNKLIPNVENINEFHIAFLRGNYQICFYLLYEYSNDSHPLNNNEEYSQIYQEYFLGNSFDLKKFLSLQETNNYSLFNMPLFFESLLKKSLMKNVNHLPLKKKEQKNY